MIGIKWRSEDARTGEYDGYGKTSHSNSQQLLLSGQRHMRPHIVLRKYDAITICDFWVFFVRLRFSVYLIESNTFQNLLFHSEVKAHNRGFPCNPNRYTVLPSSDEDKLLGRLKSSPSVLFLCTNFFRYYPVLLHL